MVQIWKPIDFIIKAAGTQKIECKKYRHLTYIMATDCPDGMLVLNLMTREFVLLTSLEFEKFNECDLSHPVVKELAERWFLVPTQNNDYKFFKQIDDLYKMICDNDKYPPVTGYTIYPTTDCNARCFYCFELACSRISMDEKTANDVADFIIKKSQGKPLSISWFGGEPLYNYPAIDTITRKLTDNGVFFKSTMVSNGYLFNEQLVKKAKNDWQLYKVQITLDGTEEVYNRCKAYIYKNVSSPYLRVLDNIELLLKNDIRVNIRLNMDTHNCDDLDELVEILYNRFGKYEYCKIYIALLFEKGGSTLNIRSLEKKKLLYERYDTLNRKLLDYGMGREIGINSMRKSTHCMADSNNSTTILPDGHLGKCEHFTDDNFYGSIYSDEINEAVINKFKKERIRGDFCHECALQPFCMPLEICPDDEDHCDEFDKVKMFESFRNRMRVSYKEFLNKLKKKEESDVVDDNCS